MIEHSIRQSILKLPYPPQNLGIVSVATWIDVDAKVKILFDDEIVVW